MAVWNPARSSPPLWLAALVIGTAFTAAHGLRVVRSLNRRHWEDGRYFHHNRDEIHSVTDCFVRPSAWSGGNEATYRPLSANLYYFAGRALFHNNLVVYHAINAGLYVFNGLLLFIICRPLLPGLLSLIPPALFVSRLAHIQVVTYTSEFDALSYVSLGLIGLALFVITRRTTRRWPQILVAVAFGLALLCKEAAVVWPAILTAYGWLFDRTTAWRKYVVGWVVAAIGALAYPHVIHALYPASAPTFAFDLEPTHLLAHYAAYLLSFPNILIPGVDPERAGWAMAPQVIALSTTVPAILLMASLLIVESMALARFRPNSLNRETRVVAFGFAWFLTATAPFAVFTDRLFMRYSYLGYGGLAVAAGGIAAMVVKLARQRASLFVTPDTQTQNLTFQRSKVPRKLLTCRDHRVSLAELFHIQAIDMSHRSEERWPTSSTHSSSSPTPRRGSGVSRFRSVSRSGRAASPPRSL